jgi:hypothetical protein
MINDHELEMIYAEMLDFTSRMVAEHGPMEVAGVMMAQALSIYKTGLDEIDFNSMVDSISSSRAKVQKFTPNLLQ